MKMPDVRDDKTWKRINRILTVLLVLISFYLITNPFLPEVELILARKKDSTQGFVYESSAAVHAGINKNLLKKIPSDNRIVIPAINVDAQVLEGNDVSILNYGQAWRRPFTSSPDKGGNTVIVGHRYFGRGKNTFYHLNKLKKGQEIIVFWEGQEYVYKINSVFETSPEDIHVEDNTLQSILTIYTCSGLSAEKRLIVKADLTSQNLVGQL